MEFDDEAPDFLAFGQDLVEPRDNSAPGTSSVDFDGLLSTPLLLHEDLAEGCGGMLWPAGMVLAKYMLRHADLTVGKTIVELGAGGGLVGLAIALANPSNDKAPVYITDQFPMLALMQKNIALNNLQGRATANIYDWGSDVPAHLPRYPDVILAADCVYFEPAFPLLHQTLTDLIGDNTTCYFCFKKRRRADLHFVKSIKRTFMVVEIADDSEKVTYGREGIFLYRITAKQS